jgi:GT2 family glycosyltransferase
VCDISVIVPTRDRPQRLRNCLAALATQTLVGRTFEVIVIDDGGAAQLGPVVEPFAGCLRLTLIEQANTGPAQARNAGAARARGALLTFTDDDCEPRNEWLSALHAAFLRHPDAMLGGHTINALPDNAFSEASQLLVDFLYNATTDATSGEAPQFFTSNNLAMSTDLFWRVGGFNRSFPLAAGEDREIGDRWRQHGLRLIRVPAAIVMHSHALAFRSFWRQHFNYGRGACQLRRARRTNGRAAGFESLGFYGRLVTYPLRARELPASVKLTALIGISQVANAAGFVKEQRSHPR